MTHKTVSAELDATLDPPAALNDREAALAVAGFVLFLVAISVLYMRMIG